MPPRPTALLVMPAGAARRQAQSALEQAGLSVRTAAEPYEATLALGDRPADLVVLDLGTYRPRDRAFLRALARRAPQTRVLLLMPAEARRLAIGALRAGADAYVLHPSDPLELGTVAARLVHDRDGGVQARALARLSGEVAHAVNNPLQVLSLWAEAPPGPRSAAPDPAVKETVARIRDVVGLLAPLGALAPPVRREHDLGRELRAALEAAARGGGLKPLAPPPPDGPLLALDPGQWAKALAALFGCLGGLAGKEAVPVRARVLPPRRRGGPHRLQVLAEGLAPAAEEVERLPTTVLRSDEATRRVHPGLAFPAAVARLHGGVLGVRAVSRGLLVTLTLPS